VHGRALVVYGYTPKGVIPYTSFTRLKRLHLGVRLDVVTPSQSADRKAQESDERRAWSLLLALLANTQTRDAAWFDQYGDALRRAVSADARRRRLRSLTSA